MAQKYNGPTGLGPNLPCNDKGTNCRNESQAPGVVTGSSNAAGPVMRAAELSSLDLARKRATDWISEMDSAVGMGIWWLIGSPTLGLKSGDLVFGPGDKQTEQIRNTAAYLEAVEIYQNWLNSGQPLGRFKDEGTSYEFVPSKGYFFVEGRTGAGSGSRGHWYEPLAHPVWGFTGSFTIRFTETGTPSVGYVNVEIENYTSLPSYLHGIAKDPGFPILERLYTKRAGVPILSRSRQVYRFSTYIPRNADPPSGGDRIHKVVVGDTLSGLAKKYYGDMHIWPIIYDRNRTLVGANPDKLRVGDSLAIPAFQKITPEQIRKARQTAHLRFPHAGIVVPPPTR